MDSNRTKTGRFKKGTSGNPKGRPRKDANTEAKLEIDPSPRLDGWLSALTGYGYAQHDKRMSTTFAPNIVDRATAVQLWRGDDLGARIIETVPNEMLREGFCLSVKEEDADKGKETQELIEAKWDDLHLTESLWEGLTYERAYGGGAILLGANDGQSLDMPLSDRVQSLDWITPLEPREIKPTRWYVDPQAPKFGQPEIYQMTPLSYGTSATQGGDRGKTVFIHESRLIVFPGIRVTRERLSGTEGWGDSILSRVISTLRDFNMSWAAAGVLTQDFSQAVFKIKGLSQLLAGDVDDIIEARIRATELSRSVVRAVMIDAEEEFERKQTPLSGLPELLDRFATRLAAAADMPLTLLMGQSPAGLNATGESDIRFFYDRVKSMQDRKLRPAIEKITSLIFRTMGQEPENWSIQFNPLWQPTEQEMAAARYTQAQADKIWIETGALMAEEVAQARFGGDGFSYETKLDHDLREEAAQMEEQIRAQVEGEVAAEMKQNGGQPPRKGEENEKSGSNNRGSKSGAVSGKR